MERKRGILFLTCCIVCIVVSGCQQGPAKQVPEPIIFSGPEITAKCIVTYYDDQGSRYISQQQHTIYPEDSVIRIKTHEPEGHFEWMLNKGVYTIISGDPSKLPVLMCSREIAQAIILSVSARGGFLGERDGIMLDPVSIAGQMYQPIIMYARQGGAITQKVYREISSNKMNWVEINNSNKKLLIAARSYNLRKLPDSDKLFPASIDIYNTDSAGRPADRIMKIDYTSFGLVSKQP